MASRPKKAAVIGLDCAMPHLIMKHIADGHLPNFKKLIDNGVLAQNCLVCYPTITPPNWASIATGAWPGTHGITDFHVHNPGTTPYNSNIVQAFSSDRCRAEFLWDTADKAGKKCIVLNYPTAWPSHMKNGIMVGGAGLSVGENRDGKKGLAGKDSLCNDQLITTGIYPQAIRGSFKPASGWKGLPKKEPGALDLEAKLNFRAAALEPSETTWYVLARQSGEDGYDRITLSPSKDCADEFCTLAVGEWSAVIRTSFKMKNGAALDGFFRCKLLELSADAEDLRLYISPIGGLDGWCNPPEVAAELQSDTGILAHNGAIIGYAFDWYDLDTFVEIHDFYTQWLSDAACSLMSRHEWDLFFMHAHSPDWAYHVMLTDMDPETNKDETKRKAAWDAHLKIYEAQDKMIENILNVCDKDTLVVLVSDHGAVSDGATFDPYRILSEAGLVVMETGNAQVSGAQVLGGRVKGENNWTMKEGRMEGLLEEAKIYSQNPDVQKSKCFPQRTMYIYINLRGRDPEGTVEPAD